MLADPKAQGGQVSLWVGALDPITGLPVATPDLRFLGEIDVPTLVARPGRAQAEAGGGLRVRALLHAMTKACA